MTRSNRSTRIQIRCTPTELANIAKYADFLNISIADLIRDSITMTLASKPDRFNWPKKLATAIAKFMNDYPWSSR
jgi:hypothetical protein